MKRTLALILALVMTMALVACGGNSTTTNPSSSKTDGPTGTAPLDGVDLTDTSDINKGQEISNDETKSYKSEIRIGAPASYDRLDPHLFSTITVAQLYVTVYNQLLYWNWDTLEIEPELAESWEAESASSYVFHLRKGVKFSNGEEFTADDVVFSLIDRPQQVNSTTTDLWKDTIEEVEIIDDYTIRFKLKADDGDFLHRLYDQTTSIMNREACEKDLEYGHWIGTGGWIIDSFAPKDKAVLSRFDDSWVWEENGINPTETLVFVDMSEGTTRSVALQTGEIAATTSVSSTIFSELAADPNMNVLAYSSQNLQYLIFNMKNGKFAESKELRQALAYAINYDDFVEYMTGGLGERAYSYWGKNQYGLYTDFDFQYEYNPEKAKELIEQSGVKDLDVKFYTSSDSYGTLLKTMLDAVGFNCNVVVTDSAGRTAAVKSGDFDLMQYSISLKTLGDRFHFVCDPTNSTNRAKYENPEMLAKFEAALAETDDTVRKELYKEIQIELHEEIPYLPMYYSVSRVGSHAGVTGIRWEPDDKPDFTHIRWEE